MNYGMTKKEREQLKLKESHKNKAKKKTYGMLRQEERDVHEAYQLILSEYHRKVIQRVKKKTKTIALLKVDSAKQDKASENASPESDADEVLEVFNSRDKNVII